MGNDNSRPNTNTSTGSRPNVRPHVSRADHVDAPQFAYVSSSSPYPGSTSQSAHSSPSGYPGSTSQSAHSSPLGYPGSTSQSAHSRNTGSGISYSYLVNSSSDGLGARPRQYQAPSDPGRTSQQSTSVYSGTNSLHAPSYPSGTNQQSTSAYPGTRRSNDSSYTSGTLQLSSAVVYPGTQSSNAPLYPSGTNQQSTSAYPGTRRSNDSSYTSGTPQLSSSVVYPGTQSSNAPQSSKKPLYMARSLSSLRERIDRAIDWSNAISLVGKARSAMYNANNAYEENDEEKAYVLYERYALMWAHIRESTDYKNNQQTFDTILGPTDIQTAYDRIDELKLSLETRYAKQHVQSSLSSRTTQAQIPSSLSSNTNSTSIGNPQRQTFLPVEPTNGNLPLWSSSNTRSADLQLSSTTSSEGSTPSQASNTRSASSALSQTANTTRVGSILSQSSNTGGAGSTPSQTANTSCVHATPSQSSNTRGAGSPPSQTANTSREGSTPSKSSKTRGAGSAPSQTASTSCVGSTPSQSSKTRGAGSTPSQTANTRGAESAPSQTHAGATPVQPSSVTKSAGATSSKAGRSRRRNKAKQTGQKQQSSGAKKDAIAGGMEGMKAHLDCPICLDLLENAKNLPCGHITCEKCIRQWVASKGGVLSCPTCKTVHPLPSDGVAGLPTNFVLNNLVADMKKLEDIESDEDHEEEQPHEAHAIPSLLDVVTPPSLAPRIPSAETSFLTRISNKSFKDAKGSTIRLRIQLCDRENKNVRGRKSDKVSAMVKTPADKKENVSVSLMKRDGDYSLSFTPSKIGIYFVEAYLDQVQVRDSPFKVVVHPSAKFDQVIGPLDDPIDVVAYGSQICVNNRGFGFLSTDWEGHWSDLYKNSAKEHLSSYGMDASDNRLYTTVPNLSCVDVYDHNDGYKNNFGKRVLESPTGIAVSREGMIYVADSETNTIDVFRSNFSHAHSISAGGDASQCSLALVALNPAEDRLIAADQGKDCFKIFDVVNMKMVKLIKTRVQQAPAKPFGVAVDEDGNIFMSVTFDPSKLKKGGKQQNSTKRVGAVVTYNSDGFFLGKFGDNELKNPRGLCIIEDKVVVVEQGADVDGPCLKVYKL